jgi:hypothetical protein
MAARLDIHPTAADRNAVRPAAALPNGAPAMLTGENSIVRHRGAVTAGEETCALVVRCVR